MDFNFREFLRCLFRRHEWKNSRTKPGYITCTYCGYRRRPRMM